MAIGVYGAPSAMLHIEGPPIGETGIARFKTSLVVFFIRQEVYVRGRCVRGQSKRPLQLELQPR
ncbi:MAG: hypothetical protein DCC67_17105 [Planctomycetota bacterium]|nr:MAG: hypothetical protein DCC67_17105 [Planctomycetota bacterium]